MNYHVSMKHFCPTQLRITVLSLSLGLLYLAPNLGFAQSPAPLAVPAPPAAQVKSTEAAEPNVQNSGLSAELFFNILLSELSLLDNEPRAAFALMLDSARKTKDEALFERAVGIALQTRSGEAALIGARAWQAALPESVTAARFVVQILIALNRSDTLAKAVSDYLALSLDSKTGNAASRDEALASVADIFTRASDKKMAAQVVEQSMAPYLNKPETAFTAAMTVGRVRLLAGDSSGALESARQAQALQPSAGEPALLALALMGPKVPLAEQVVKHYIDTPANMPKPEIRLLYSRTLLSNARFSEALAQAVKLSTEAPTFAQGWLVLGSLQFQDSQDHNDSKAAAAQVSLKKFIELAPSLPEEQRTAGLSRAFLLLSQIAENNKDFEAAKTWLAQVSNTEEAFSVQNRRASLLAKQGKLEEALALLAEQPESTGEEAQLKLTAQVQLLRDNRQYQRAYDLLSKAINKLTADAKTSSAASPDLSDLHYDLAMLAEKLERLDDMERLLKLVIAAKPEHHHAYNALGYSLAERRLRLPEAKALIQKAVQLSPNDPFIADSLGWVEFRLGNTTEAQRILETAFKSKPDAEIAAHLGEVLWSQGRKAEATAMWKTGLNLNPNNDTLVETLKRLGIKP